MRINREVYLKLLFIFIFSSSIYANYLTVVQESKIVQKRNGQVIKMPAGASNNSIDKMYYHNGKMASYQDGKIAMIIDANTGVMYNFIKGNRYIEMNLKDMMKKIAEKMEAKGASADQYAAALSTKMGVTFKSLNKSKTIKGHKCDLYQTISNTNYTQNVKKQKWSTKHKNTTTHCYMNNPPEAFKEYTKKVAKGYGAIPKNISSKIKTEGNPHFGLDIHNESAMSMSFTPPPGTKPEIAEMMKKMMPVTYNINTLKELHTKPFDKSLVNLPKGAKKFERAKKR